MTNHNSKNHSHSAVYPTTITCDYSPTQQMALYLYGLGFNVFPQPHGKKYGLPWKQLQYTRLHPTHAMYGIAALTAGKCNLAILCGHTSNNLFVIDCETPEALNHHISQLQQRHIPLWIVETARGGHIYLQCADGEVASIESKRLKDAEVRGSNGYVLAAGSVHPTGMIYQWLHRQGDKPPTVHLRDIEWLIDIHGKPIRLKLTKSKGHKFTPFTPLSRATQDYLTNGHLIPKGSRNNSLFKAACDMLGCGYTPDEIEQKLAPIAQYSGLPQNEIYSTLHSAASHERQPSRPQHLPTPKEPPPQIWKGALDFAKKHHWSGTTATSDKMVFLALVERAKTASNDTLTFRASHREISELARCTLRTIRSALKRLTKAQYIKRMGYDRVSQASLWRFNEKILERELESNPSPALPHWESYSESLFNSSDVLERGALGYNGLYLYRGMVADGQPLMPKALAALSGLSVNKVNYALTKLHKFDLVRREKGGWRALALSDEALERQVALPAGKLGRGAARRRQYAQERALYIGALISNARLAMFREEFLAEARSNPLSVNLAAGEGTEGKLEACASALKIWRCPNCGQHHFAEVPPDMCDFCQDFTTWQPLPEPEPMDEELVRLLADPVVKEGLALGGVLEFIDIRGERRCYPQRE